MFLDAENGPGTPDHSLRRAVALSRTGSVTFRGSFSEIIAREEKQDEIAMYDALFPQVIDTKEKRTYFANPIHDEDENAPTEAYVIRDPDGSDDGGGRKTPPRTFSVRMSSLVNKLLTGGGGETQSQADPDMPRRSFSMRISTPLNSRSASNATATREKSSSSAKPLKKTSSTETSDGNNNNNNSNKANAMRVSSVRLLKRLTGRSDDANDDLAERKSLRMSLRLKKVLFSN